MKLKAHNRRLVWISVGPWVKLQWHKKKARHYWVAT